MDPNGMAIRMSATVAASAVTMAEPLDIFVRRVPPRRAGFSPCSGCSSPASTRARSLRFSALPPIRDSRAGVSVTAISTAMATQAAATVPIRPRNGMPVTFSAARAMITVRPANTTALPEVPLARPMDSRTGMPAFSCWRWRLTMNRA